MNKEMKLLLHHLENEVVRLELEMNEFNDSLAIYEHHGKILAYKKIITLINEDLFDKLYEHYN
tara:strand:- start:934 stop:1122 length:189 start_codon:yes stop_codon:yes gene_type:complete